jgi:hypothetical protein
MPTAGDTREIADSVFEDCQVQVSRTAHIPAVPVRSPSPSPEGCDTGPSGAPG